MATKPTPQQVLDLPLPDNDADAATIRDYLIALLRLVWRDEQCFDGKRPFGNSSWQYDIAAALVRAGWVTGSIDEDGYVETCDTRQVDALMDEAIRALAGGEVPR